MRFLYAFVMFFLAAASASAQVSTGIDVLQQNNFAPLREIATKHEGRLRLAILTNSVGIDGKGRRTIDVLRQDGEAAVPGMKVIKLFSPEHGIDAVLDHTDIGDAVDQASGLEIISLYGATEADRRPSAQQLADVDVIVIDLQDVGVRYWTFQTIMKYFLQASAEHHVDLVILDRPNPINGVAVQGPLSAPGRENYVNPHAEPMRPGMTMGELATFFNAEDNIGALLTVVRMSGWKRSDWYDETGLMWINPSPNLRSVAQATLYAGMALLEGTNVNVKGPYEASFVRFGASWMNGVEVAAYLNAREIPGVGFMPVTYVPSGDFPFSGQRIEGVEIIVNDRNILDAPALGVEAVSALLKLYPTQFEIDRVDRLLLNQTVLDQIKAGDDPREIAAGWQDELNRYKARREQHLLYR